MQKNYNKLVRDKIPAIIKATGKQFKTAVYNDENYRQALSQKLIEEANELLNVESQKELIEELADVYEVIDAILALNRINQSEIIATQKRKRIERGAFNNRVQLMWVET